MMTMTPMTMMTTFAAAWLLLMTFPTAKGFHSPITVVWKSRGASCIGTTGELYNSPTITINNDAPPPSKGAGDDYGDDNDEKCIDDESPSARLFTVGRDGSEKSGLLPPLTRKALVDGPTQYGEQDPQVVNLVSGLDVAWEDASWALEAYEGDPNQAWETISIEKRKTLDDDVALPEALEIDWNLEVSEATSD
eukprot:CAMPEP_0119006438 /NCGR_PEP_ID=MMETSP1176-20130426/2292_1 /TAXON_ID=265551 /ORGANISM="Synedropsis recta cf, Strain CCMP1620" /LENGTH=192 /DNA_ID=CAMNT_0006958347 /DNA_START=30 /DNA_END=608 /DNA_ORIENTATION=+